MKYEIEEKNRKLKYGFIGMNSFAAKAHNIPYPKKHPEHIIQIDRMLPKKVRLDTIHHEEAEEYFMKNKYFDYHRAHQLALKFEKKEVPFPNTDIKKKLIKIGLIKR